MRCLTLADALIKNGNDVQFICRNEAGNMAGFIEKKGFTVHYLLENWKQDAAETISILQKANTPIDWVIIDHYEISKEWEASIRPFVKKIMVIDDLANREHDCDILVDQTYGETGERYKGKFPPYCTALFGIDYALLRPQFRNNKKMDFQFNKRKIIIHIFFGGNDEQNYTGKFSTILLENFPQFSLKAVVGDHFGYTDCLIDLEKKYDKRFEWKQNLVQMAEYMARCDLALGAPGTTTWERACVGLPAAYLSINHNQKEILEALEQRGLCRFFGDAATIEDDDFIRLTNAFICNGYKLNAMYQRCVQCVDGFGTKRIVEALN
jgi:UDP-2,4-diacetamido-2,4,6-trideoxy-beta-L-altropyranose hydrolase